MNIKNLKKILGISLIIVTSLLNQNIYAEESPYANSINPNALYPIDEDAGKMIGYGENNKGYTGKTMIFFTPEQIRLAAEVGTSAIKDVPVSGNASTSQVVLGSDTRLSDARTPLIHTHAASDIISGNFSDARISQSNVTQHQVALSIASSQITGTKTSSYISDFSTAADVRA